MRQIGPVRAALFNLLGPGLGYLYLGRMRLAFVLLAAGLGIAAFAGWSRLILSPEATYVFGALIATIGLVPFIHCAVLAARNREVPTRPYNRWWVYVLWIIGAWILSNLLTQIRAPVFGFEPFRIPATSMAPTIREGDFVMTDTWYFDRTKPQHGDLVVFGLPSDPAVKFVKRVVGLPGDRIEIRNDVLYRNGKALEEPYITLVGASFTAASNFGPVDTPDGHYFMLGDNRHRSKDSRFIGAISRDLLHGRVEHRWFAYNDGIRWERFPERLGNGDPGRPQEDPAPEPFISGEQGRVPPSIDSNDLIPPIDWRPRPSEFLEEYPETYDELRTLAEAGDAEASRRLYMLLWECGSAPPPQSDAEIAETVAEVRRTRQFPTYQDGILTMVDMSATPDALEGVIGHYEAIVRTCQDVSMAQRAEEPVWLEHTMQQGGAAPLLNHLLATMDAEAGFQLISDVWETGDPWALQSFAHWYGEAWRDGTDPSGRTKEYAYYLAFIELNAQEDPAASWDQMRNELDETYRSQMHDHEIVEVENMVWEIIDDNPNCCMLFQ